MVDDIWQDEFDFMSVEPVCEIVSEGDGIERSATFSRCMTWRYTLERYWDKSKPFVLFILLNPSTADGMNDDPTNRRGINYAKDWGYGGVVFCNLFAYRTPYPKELKKCDVDKAIGIDNETAIRIMCDRAGIIICAWGIHGKLFNRHDIMCGMLWFYEYKPFHMGLTKHGFPRHILYLKSSIKPQLWEQE